MQIPVFHLGLFQEFDLNFRGFVSIFKDQFFLCYSIWLSKLTHFELKGC